MDQKLVGSFLKELRKAKNITQEQLAEKLNVSGRTVSRWENGNNMPDISLLVEISELFDVSIPEIIDGKRKGENMNEEVKDVAKSMSDYALTEKEALLKEIRKLSLIGLLGLVAYFVIDMTKLGSHSDIFQMISVYGQTLVFVTTLLIPLYATGLLSKFKNKDKSSRIPKPFLWAITLIVAIVIAVVVNIVI